MIAKPPRIACGLSLRQRDAALPLSRTPYDRLRKPHKGQRREGDLRRHLHRPAWEGPTYGYRRLPHALQRQGVNVNHKRILRLIREEQLVRRRRQPFVRTTHSQSGFPRYPTLLPRMSLTGLDDVWHADITYIRFPKEFVDLAMILAACSRRCIGWVLEPSLEAELPLRALRMALATRPVPPDSFLTPIKEGNMSPRSTRSDGKAPVFVSA